VVAIAAVISDIEGRGGRQFDLVGGGGLTLHDHKESRIVVTNCVADPSLNGTLGWVYDNDANGIYVELDSDTYGAFAPGDTFTIMTFPTTMTFPAGVCLLKNTTISFEDMIIEGNTFFVMTGGYNAFKRCVYRVSGFGGPGSYPDGEFWLEDVYLKHNIAGQFQLGLATTDSIADLEGVVIIDGWFGGTSYALITNNLRNQWWLGGKLTLANCEHWHLGADSYIRLKTRVGAAPPGKKRPFVRAHQFTGSFLRLLAIQATGRGRTVLPAVYGDCPAGYLVSIATSDIDLLDEYQVHFMETPDVVTTGITNECRIGTVGRYDYGEIVKVFGTGNWAPISYLAAQVNEVAALAEIRRRLEDTNYDGTGNPQTGHTFYDTTATAMKVYDGAWNLV